VDAVDALQRLKTDSCSYGQFTILGARGIGYCHEIHLTGLERTASKEHAGSVFVHWTSLSWESVRVAFREDSVLLYWPQVASC